MDIAAYVHLHYGHTSLLDLQLQAIRCDLEGKSLSVYAPTGCGKSLCYAVGARVAATERNALTLYITPQLSLGTDQLASLRRRGVRAVAVTGKSSRAERAEALSLLNEAGRAAVSGPLMWERTSAVVILTSEMISSLWKGERRDQRGRRDPTSDTVWMLALSACARRGGLARIVYDEVQALVESAEYRAAGQLVIDFFLKRPEFCSVPITTLSATPDAELVSAVRTAFCTTSRSRPFKEFLEAYRKKSHTSYESESPPAGTDPVESAVAFFVNQLVPWVLASGDTTRLLFYVRTPAEVALIARVLSVLYETDGDVEVYMYAGSEHMSARARDSHQANFTTSCAAIVIMVANRCVAFFIRIIVSYSYYT